MTTSSLDYLVWPLLGPNPAEDGLVEDEFYSEGFTEGLRIHKAAGVKLCPSLEPQKSKPCDICRTSFQDPYYMWRMRVKLSRDEPMSALGTPLKTFGHAAGSMARSSPQMFDPTSNPTKVPNGTPPA